MHIIVIGLNHQTAPVEIRERLTFAESELEDAVITLKNQKSILENVILSTCNRTEIYAVVDQLHTGRYYVKQFLSQWFQLKQEEFSPYLYIHEEDEAIEHLFKVASGLNSMILGETQIIGQVRTSFLTAQQLGSTGTLFNELFKQVLTLAKRAHSETEISSNAVSVSYAAVELAKKVFGTLDNKHVLIIGAGKMSELAIKNLYGNGASKVTVINRTYSRAQDLASRFSGEAIPYEKLQCALVDADILISSTGANNFIITKSMMENVVKLRKGKPLFMVDIAVPRDLDPSLSELNSVFLYDIDDLKDIVQANLVERKQAAKKIMVMIEEYMSDFKQWVNMLGVVPVISALREKALAIQAETMKSIERKLPDLTDRERNVLGKHTRSIINQMLRDPILQAKEFAGYPNSEQALDLFIKIFNLGEHEKLNVKKGESEPSAKTEPLYALKGQTSLQS